MYIPQKPLLSDVDLQPLICSVIRPKHVSRVLKAVAIEEMVIPPFGVLWCKQDVVTKIMFLVVN